MSKLKIRRLGRHESLAIEALKAGNLPSEAYLLAYPKYANTSGQDLNLRASRFFSQPRIQDFMNSTETGTPSAIHGEIMPRERKGRPTKYHPDIVQKMIDYFDIEPYTVEITENEVTGEITRKKIISNLPTKAGFAAKSRVSRDTFNAWATATDKDGNLKYPDFSAAYKTISDYQEHILVTNTLNGSYKENFAKFLAKNYLGFRDNAELTVSGDPDKPLVVVNTDMTPEQAALAYRDFLDRD